MIEDGEETDLLKKKDGTPPWEAGQPPYSATGMEHGNTAPGMGTDRVRCRREQHQEHPWGQRSHCTKLDRGRLERVTRESDGMSLYLSYDEEGHLRDTG